MGLLNICSQVLFLAGLAVSASGNPTALEGFGPASTNLAHSAGTAAQISPDDTVLYVTSDEGTVLAFDPMTGSELWRHKFGWANYCRSGVSFSPDGTKFVVAVGTEWTSWLVVYPHDPTNSQPIPGEPIWSSASMNGKPSGTPVFGSDNESLYVTHNANMVGMFSVFNITWDQTRADASAATYTKTYDELKLEDTIATSGFAGPNTEWSPVGIARKPDEGNYREGLGNDNDVIVWAHRAVNGNGAYASFSYIYQPPLEGGTPNVRVLAPLKFSTWSAPIFSADGQDMCLGVSRGAFRCWAGQQFQLGSNIKMNPRRNGPNPVNSKPVMTALADKAFFATNRKEVWGVDLATPDSDSFGSDNRTLFIAQGLDELPDAGALITPNEATVIIITQSGRVYAINTLDGSFRWIYPTALAEPVSADASLSSDGSILWFVTTTGTLSAWNIPFAELPPTEMIVPVPAPTAATNDAPSPSAEPGAPVSPPVAAPAAAIDDTPAAPAGAPTATAPSAAAPTAAAPTAAEVPTAVEAPTADFGSRSPAASMSSFQGAASLVLLWLGYYLS